MKNIGELYRNTEEKLKNYKKIKCRMLNLKIDLALLINDFEGIKAIDYSKECIKSEGNVSSSIENEIIYKEKKVKRIENEIKRLEAEIEKIVMFLVY